ncbi:MAG TPA: hypothetical protein VF624_19310, partial [Tepidisphaeraceae bacterium]
KQLRMTANDASYDPARNLITARGTGQQPVELTDVGGTSSGSFDEVVWNLQTNRPEQLKNVRGAVRR